jgi:hypothetical protein
MFETLFTDVLNPEHELLGASRLIDGECLHEALPVYYSPIGCHGKSIRLMVGIHILTHRYSCSDDRGRWRCCMRTPTGNAFAGSTPSEADPPETLSHLQANRETGPARNQEVSPGEPGSEAGSHRAQLRIILPSRVRPENGWGERKGRGTLFSF